MENNVAEMVKHDQGGVPLSPSGSVNMNNGAQQAATAPPSKSKASNRPQKPRCRFFNTKSGCRAGDSCPFRHEAPSTHTDNSNKDASDVSKSDQLRPSVVTAKQDQPRAQQPNTTPSAIPTDTRTFQINQIKRRFRPKEETQESGLTILTFSMPPSDPDFPFDISALECIMKVPASFPKGAKPTIRVTNKEMERGFQINVEQGFDEIWRQAVNPTLLNAMKMLDKRLESVLTAQKAEIVKIIANSGVVTPATTSKSKEDNTHISKIDAGTPKTTEQKMVAEMPKPQPAPSPQRIAEASKKRETETQLLEHRLGKASLFAKSNDGFTFTIPVEPRKRDQLPSSIQSIKAIRLIVPLSYDIEPCSIEIPGVHNNISTAVCNGFTSRGIQHPESTLLAQVNYLAQNMHLMAQNTAEKSTPKVLENRSTEISAQKYEDLEPSNVPYGIVDTDRDHLKIIPRPPEWDSRTHGQDDDEISTDGYDSEVDSSYDDLSDEGLDTDRNATDQNKPSNKSATPREKGILVSFPGLELHGIELLELVQVNIAVKCERCKDSLDVQRIKPQSDEQDGPTTQIPSLHSTSCKKCANPFTIGYRKDIMHMNSFRAGYLDLEGCTISDLLPSLFLPTCAECSTPATNNAGGVTSVRGESTMSICRTCHRKMVFRLPEVKFLHVGGATSLHHLPLKPKHNKPKETLGIVAGTPLPGRGRCKHYSKSYRWFRFSCCNKVFACDRCHDAETDHPNEFANRMICGWCSREQLYRPEDCGIASCRKDITGRSRSGFWEGGKGTRERARMSRKDPRKYKRRGGGAVATAKHS